MFSAREEIIATQGSTAFNPQFVSEYPSTSSTISTSASPPSILEIKHSWASSSLPLLQEDTNTGSAKLQPHFPNAPSILPCKISNTSYTQANAGIASSSSMSDSRIGTFSTSGSTYAYQLPQVAPSFMVNRPGSPFSSIQQHQVPNPPSLSPSIITQSPLPSGQLPLQPPQLPRPPLLPPHLRPVNQVTQSSDQGFSLPQTPIQLQVQPLQMPSQLQIPIMYYQPAQQDHISVSQQSKVEQTKNQNLPQQADTASQKQESGMSLQQYFASPEAIQSLLSDREKLCQLLEQHPKLMQMLQERLGQL